MRAMIELKHLLEEEIQKIVRKGDITPTELERLDEAVDIIKDIETICAMKEYSYPEEELGYSERYPYYMRGMSRNSYNSYENSRRAGGDPRMDGYMMDPRYYGDRGSYESGTYARDGSYNRGGSYADGRSYEYGGNSRGYSGHASKEDLKKDLQDMISKASSDKERMAIQQLLDQWKDS